MQKRAEDEACKEQQEVQGEQQQEEGSTRAAADGKPRLAASERVQLVCMSATLPGPKAFARCLAARSYMTSYRPIQLDHYLVSGQIGQQVSTCVLRPALRGEPQPPLMRLLLTGSLLWSRRVVMPPVMLLPTPTGGSQQGK